MELAKAAVNDLEGAGFSAGQTLGDDTDRNSFSSRIGNLQRRLSNLGDRGPLGTIVRAFGNLGSSMLEPIRLGAEFAQNFERMGSVAQGFIGIGATLTIGIAGISAALAALVGVAIVAASVLGTLTAIVADLVAPVTILATLLGGLGLGFGIAAKRAADGGPHLDSFAKKVATLGSMFHRTSTILAQVFLPYLNELADAAEKALNFLDKVVRLPLEQAFHKIDTQGTKMLGQFVDRVAQVLSKPIKLAFHVAFQDSAFSNMVADWWHRFTGFLFGEMQRKPIRLASGRIIGFSNRQIDGVFQPFLNWFNRHNFTKQGVKIGNAVARGIGIALGEAHIQDFLVTIFKNAAIKSAQFWVFAVKSIVTKSIPMWLHLTSTMRSAIINAASNGASAIKSKLGDAFDWVANQVRGIWNRIVSFIEQPISISINWPSPPSWFDKIPGSGIVKDVVGAIGDIPHPGFVAQARPRVAMAAPNVFVTVHAADLSDEPTRRRIARQVGREITADWRRRAGGH